MEERQIKRLLIIVVVSIAIIMLFKWMLTDTLTTMSKTAAEKKQAQTARPAPAPAEPSLPPSAAAIETSAATTDEPTVPSEQEPGTPTDTGTEMGAEHPPPSPILDR